MQDRLVSAVESALLELPLEDLGTWNWRTKRSPVVGRKLDELMAGEPKSMQRFLLLCVLYEAVNRLTANP